MTFSLTTIPNLLTQLRIILIPCFVVVFYLPIPHRELLTAGIFCLAGITDWLDGYLARKLNQTSRFGAFLDPVADKLIVAVALVMLVGEYAAIWITIPALVIVCREITISALREWMAEVGQHTSVSVSYIGKCKTTIQILAIILLLSQPADWGLSSVKIGIVLLYIAMFLTLWSMITYLRAAWDTLVSD
jgi:CDP-diacylglycerol--glycerol-3-phosphate 3-phosphatidyltransferase